MQNIIISDIFGRTKELEEFSSNFNLPTEIHDPYSAKYMSFSSEKEAYNYFLEKVTLNKYAETLLNRIQSIESPVNLIGFSIGASAIWKISDIINLNVKSAYCYYGSQIRNHLDIEPLFPICLTFPSSEIHFSVNELMDKLANKNNVTIRQVPFLHGFMNHHSVNFNKKGYEQEISVLSEMSFNKFKKIYSDDIINNDYQD
ncbi:hypothetical protein [Halarcobacter anaerophilus]|uniref:Dienelactone hydrolase domain-containing protein n=1 Tax=Halarcobacter anaerophilus TaxID=877500 RepID=A0A4Q0Y179_9BACT|nr:hypothetical protein [Halarcobacter anaerophilus]QDF28663.1 hypothetical protein AANAER_1177 [Halarcobacter anaerophilus]RXJ63383.1 hypothetical protein CRV06_06825 [Halarcobacter anaerophilus]